MQKKKLKKLLSLLLAVVLVAAVALTTVGCSDNQSTESADAAELSFQFVVVDSKGNETDFTITTTKTIVGDALVDEGLIAGEDSQYGLYVKTVNGETLDYDKDGMYWSFYIDGEYAMSGVDTTEIEEGKIYCFKAEKA